MSIFFRFTAVCIDALLASSGCACFAKLSLRKCIPGLFLPTLRADRHRPVVYLCSSVDVQLSFIKYLRYIIILDGLDHGGWWKDDVSPDVRVCRDKPVRCQIISSSDVCYGIYSRQNGIAMMCFL